jgi:hypothetical protein
MGVVLFVDGGLASGATQAATVIETDYTALRRKVAEGAGLKTDARPTTLVNLGGIGSRNSAAYR